MKIQPIHVDDLGECLNSWLEDPSLVHEAYDLGGPEVVTFADFLGRVHTRKRGGRARFLRIPLGLSMSACAWLEKPLLPLLPLTAGQLHVFAYDSTAKPNRLWERHHKSMKNVEAMLDDLLKYA